MFKKKIKKFSNLYEVVINSIDYYKISENLSNYSKNQILKINETINKKIEKLKEFFNENKKILSTLENLEIIILNIEDCNLYFEWEFFSDLLYKYNIKIENIEKDLEKFNKNQISKIFIELIDIIKEDFENSVLLSWFKNNEIEEIHKKNKLEEKNFKKEIEKDKNNKLKIKQKKLIKEFLNLYTKILNSINYQNIKKSLKNYKRINIINFYTTINNQTNILKTFFIENKNEFLTKENIKKIIFKLYKNSLFFNSESFYKSFLKFNIKNFNKDLKQIKKNQILELFIEIIEHLKNDFINNILIK